MADRESDHDDTQLGIRLVKRAMAQFASGQGPRPVELPECKDSFPKLLCLDLNQWVYLGRAHYARAGGERFNKALDAVRQAVAGHKLVVPVLSANLLEAAGSADSGRRERLAQFMVELAGNQSLVRGQVVLRAEVRRAIQTTFDLPVCGPFRSRLVRWGMHAALGREPIVKTGDPVADDILLHALDDPEASVRAIVRAFDPDTVACGRVAGEQCAQTVAAVRLIDGHLKTEGRKRIELANLTAKGDTAKLVRDVLSELDVDPRRFLEWLDRDSNIVHFWSLVPGIDVFATLLLSRDTNPDQRCHRNDDIDLGFLQLAIPYANVVVTEKSWAHLAEASGVAKKYGSLVLGDITKLPETLARLGCQ